MAYLKRVDKKERRSIGYGIYLGVLFAAFGFLGSYSANFLWWWQAGHPRTLIFSGVLALIVFFVIALSLLRKAKLLLW